MPLPVMPGSGPLAGETILLTEHLEDIPVHSGHIKGWTKRDPFLSPVLRCTLEGWPKAVNSDELTPYYTKRTKLSVKDGGILWGTRVIVPPQGRSKFLSELHAFSFPELRSSWPAPRFESSGIARALDPWRWPRGSQLWERE